MIRQFASQAADDAVRDRIFNGGNLTKYETLTPKEQKFACMMLEVFNSDMMHDEERAMALGVTPVTYSRRKQKVQPR